MSDSEEEAQLRGCEAALALPEVREYWEHNRLRLPSWWARHIRAPRPTSRPRTRPGASRAGRNRLRPLPGDLPQPDEPRQNVFPGPMVHHGYNEPIPLAEIDSFGPLSIYALALNSYARRLSRRRPAPRVQQASAEQLEMVEAQDPDAREPACWLMKAEPDSRIVKGKDVAFSVDHFEARGTEHWDGVRNPLAGKYMKSEMKNGDKILFYHSNTKVPGVAAFAEVTKEGYPDHTAWDPQHPYYDAKTDKDKPKWYMVDVTFKERVPHFVPLSLYKYLAETATVPESLNYLTQEHLAAIKAMPLINRGRLSVQPVSQLAYEATELLGRNGGFDDIGKKPARKAAAKGKRKAKDDEEDAEQGDGHLDAEAVAPSDAKDSTESAQPLRQSQRKKAKN